MSTDYEGAQRHAAAGWHADPTGRHQYRYFDGWEWSPHVADAGVQGNDPLDRPPPPSDPWAAEPTTTVDEPTTAPSMAPDEPGALSDPEGAPRTEQAPRIEQGPRIEQPAQPEPAPRNDPQGAPDPTPPPMPLVRPEADPTGQQARMSPPPGQGQFGGPAHYEGQGHYAGPEYYAGQGRYAGSGHSAGQGHYAGQGQAYGPAGHYPQPPGYAQPTGPQQAGPPPGWHGQSPGPSWYEPTPAGLSLPEAVQRVMGKYVDFKGRASRSEYWWFILAANLTMVGVGLVVGLLVAPFATFPETALLAGYGAYVVVALALFLPSLGVSVRRLHDTDKSGAFVLLALIPYVGPLILLVLMALRGTTWPNQYGQPATVRR